jgi:hypothetical protein
LANGSSAEITGLTKENERDKQKTRRDFTADAFLEVEKKNSLCGSDVCPSVYQSATFFIQGTFDGQ